MYTYVSRNCLISSAFDHRVRKGLVSDSDVLHCHEFVVIILYFRRTVIMYYVFDYVLYFTLCPHRAENVKCRSNHYFEAD